MECSPILFFGLEMTLKNSCQYIGCLIKSNSYRLPSVGLERKPLRTNEKSPKLLALLTKVSHLLLNMRERELKKQKFQTGSSQNHFDSQPFDKEKLR